MTAKVIKFGGAILDKKSSYERIPEIISSSDKPLVVVISAIAKTTRNLERVANIAKSGQIRNATDKLNEIKSLHTRVSNAIFTSELRDKISSELNEIFIKAEGYLEGIAATEELTKKTLDKVLAIGEELSALIFSNYLIYKGFDSLRIPSKDIIITDSNHGNASPDFALCKENIERNLSPKLKDHEVIVTEGFSAVSTDGETTTMGKESSNLTATIIASVLNSKEVVICTDVKGLSTADPKLIRNTEHIPSMSYKQASIAAGKGLKLIYPKMISILRENDGMIKYRSIDNFAGPSTHISNGSETEMPVVIIQKVDEYQVTDIDINDRTKLIDYLSSQLNDNFSRFVINSDSIDIFTDKKLNLSRIADSSQIASKFDLMQISVLFADDAKLSELVLKFKKEFRFRDKIELDCKIEAQTLVLIVPMEYGIETAQFIHDFIF